MLGYVSDDDIIIKRSGHNYYSRDDFRDSYCHTERSIATLENRRSQSTNFLFGCLSSYQVMKKNLGVNYFCLSMFNFH